MISPVGNFAKQVTGAAPLKSNALGHTPTLGPVRARSADHSGTKLTAAAKIGGLSPS